jgi:hypothetical protein
MQRFGAVQGPVVQGGGVGLVADQPLEQRRGLFRRAQEGGVGTIDHVSQGSFRQGNIRRQSFPGSIAVIPAADQSADFDVGPASAVPGAQPLHKMDAIGIDGRFDAEGHDPVGIGPL